MELFLQATIAGLLLGGVYALISVGLNLIFGIVRVINFAHGELVMVAMFITYWLWYIWGIDPYASLIIVGPLMFLLGLALQRGILQPIQRTSANMKIFATVGVSIVLQNLALYLWGGQHRAVATDYSTAVVRIGDFAVSVPRLIAFGGALLLVAALFFALNRTTAGNVLRAIAEDRDTARLIGIPVNKFYLVATGTSALLAGVAGVLLTPFTSVFPTYGFNLTLIAFVVVVIGGLGSMFGALVGGLLLGVIETLAGTFIAPSLQQVVLFGIFILVILLRPQGLFGRGAGTEEVGFK